MAAPRQLTFEVVAAAGKKIGETDLRDAAGYLGKPDEEWSYIKEVYSMAKASWNGEVIAESDDIVCVEGNAYFPRESLKHGAFEESSHQTICPWKGRASYLDVVIDGKRNDNAAWYYPNPSPLARKIKDRVAFWRGVEVRDANGA